MNTLVKLVVIVVALVLGTAATAEVKPETVETDVLTLTVLKSTTVGGLMISLIEFEEFPNMICIIMMPADADSDEKALECMPREEYQPTNE